MTLKMQDIAGVLIAVAACQLADVLGVLASWSGLLNWYPYLQQPTFTPPGIVFSVVWTVLYTLLGIAAYLIFRLGWQRPDVRQALYLFTLQIILNTLWSVLFFGAHAVFLSLLEMYVLWVVIAMTMLAFAKLSKPAMWLLVPYFLWVTFASCINFAVWQLNT